MISSEDVLPYERPALSKGFLLKKDLDLPAFNTCAFAKQSNEMKWYNDNNITVKLSTTVTKIDYENKTISTDKGSNIKYQKLLLATGCSAIKFSDFLSKEKSEFNHIYYLRDIKDARNIKKIMFNDNKDKECVVIGGGYIGMEVTAALIQTSSFKKITMVFPEEHMMASRGLFTKEIAGKYHDLYKKNGVNFMCNSNDIMVESFEGDKDGNVEFVKLKNGKKVKADVVIVGIGARANVGLFKDELEIDGETKGLKVDKYLKSDSNQDVYGCGDIISFNCGYLQRMTRLEHVRHARSSGIFAMKAMGGKLSEDEEKNGYEFLPVFYSRVFGQSWIFYGDNPKIDGVDCEYEVKVYCKEIEGGDGKKERQFKLCCVWMEKEGKKVVGVLVDSDDEKERKMAEDFVRNKNKFDELKEFVGGFISEVSEDEEKDEKDLCGDKRVLDKEEDNSDEPQQKRQRIESADK